MEDGRRLFIAAILMFLELHWKQNTIYIVNNDVLHTNTDGELKLNNMWKKQMKFHVNFKLFKYG